MTTNLAWILIAATGMGGERSGNKMEAVVATGDTELRVEAGDDTLRLHGLRPLPAGTDWIAGAAEAAPVPLIPSIEMDGRRLPVHWRAAEQRKDRNEYTTAFRFVCDRPAHGAEIGLAGTSRPRTC